MWIYEIAVTTSVYGDDPMTFNPDRDVPAIMEKSAFDFQGFGGGRRMCIGKLFAVEEIMATLPYLFYRFDMSLKPNHPTFDYHTVTTAPHTGINLVFTPRH